MESEDEEPVVTVKVTMTPEEYIAIKKHADWQWQSVARFLVDDALGKTRRGC